MSFSEYATMEKRAEVRFHNLCVDDKLRLQKLIKELATASQQLNQKNEKIQKLEIDLAERQKEQAQIDLERKGIQISPLFTPLYTFGLTETDFRGVGKGSRCETNVFCSTQ